MKIGILTFHRAWNYGAVLQCYALQELLKESGNKVAVINYKQPWTESICKIFDYKKLKNAFFHPRFFCNYLFQAGDRSCQKKIYNDFVTRHLNTTQECDANSIPSDFDLYIIGSDQLWGLNCLGGKLDRVYMGDFTHRSDARVVGYAISSNKDSLDTIGADNLIKYASNFNALSFREKSLGDYFEKLTSIKVHIDLDPTLLSGSQMWDSIVDEKYSKQKYLVVYQVRRNNELLQKAKRIAKENGWKVVDMSSMRYSVESFVSLIKYSQCVITSSFHATVFSLIFRKRFYAVKLNDGLDARYVDLLNSIEAGGAIVDISFKPSVPPLLDYDNIFQSLERIRRPSIDYLKDWTEKIVTDSIYYAQS